MRSASRFLLSITTVGLLALSAITGAQETQNQRFRRVSSGVIPDHYIVVLKDGTPSAMVQRHASDLSGLYSGEVGFVYQHALKGFSVRMSETAALALSADARVQYVEEDAESHLVTTQVNPPSWGLDRIDQHTLPLDSAYTYVQTGSGVKVYIIDSGIRFSHVDFGGRALLGADFTGGDGTDCLGHGTHVAGTIGGSSYGIAKNATLYAVRVFGCSGTASNSTIIAGIDWVTGHHGSPAVANLSLGGSGDSSVDSAVRNMINSGVVAAVAAGNGANNNGIPVDAGTQSPARVTEAITVGATDISDARASFSNFGSVLDVFAPGVGITSDYNSSDTATAVFDGTSMATPHVAGVVARYREANPTDSPSVVQQWLKAAATAGVVGNPGTGSPNRLLFASANLVPTIQRPTTDVADGTGGSGLCYAGANFPSQGPMPNAWDSSDTTASSVDTSFTYATNIPVGYGRAIKNWAAPTGSYAFLQLKIKSNCSNQNTTYPTGCSVSYSQNNGTTWTNVYSTHLNRGLVTDAIVLPASQDLTQLRVYACSSGEVYTGAGSPIRIFPSFAIYDVRIEGH
jgi:subtilisin family serine protease